MKLIHYPYLMIDSTWGATLDLNNTGVNTEKVKLVIRKGGNRIETNITIAPNMRYTLDETTINTLIGNAPEAFSISFLANSAVTALCGMYMKDASGIKFFNIMPETDMSAAPMCLYNGSGIYRDMSANNTAYKFYGMPEGKYLSHVYGSLVDYCLSQDYLNSLHPLVIGDCCRMDAQNLEGHPEGSHSGVQAPGGGRAIDVNYPRHDGGYTQYRPDGTLGAPIFSEDGILLSNYFDYTRFVAFLYTLKRYFPNMTVRVDQRILTFLQSMYGSLVFIQGDYPEQYNHDKHAHIDLGTAVAI